MMLVQWGPQFVAHVGQEVRFESVCFVELQVQLRQLIDSSVQFLG